MWAYRQEAVIATAGVLAGTIAGAGVLRSIPDSVFRKVVAVILAVLGVSLILRSL